MAAKNLLASIAVDGKVAEREAISLNNLYARIPATRGCMENLTEAKSCGAWCCEKQNPQLLRVEFRNTWLFVTKTFDDAEVIALIGRALRNFLSTAPAKSCIFWDKSTKLCSTHPARPFACRVYGIMPEDEWKPKYEALMVINPDARPQCGLVDTFDGKPFSKKDSDLLWRAAMSLEQSAGVPRSLINDGPKGSYRTFHDHIVTNLFSPEWVTNLMEMKLNATDAQKDSIVTTVLSLLASQAAADSAAKPDAVGSAAVSEGSVTVSEGIPGSGGDQSQG